MNINSPMEEQQRNLQSKENRREYWQQYYLKNREKVLQKCRERRKQWYAHNKEQSSDYQKAYYKQHADELRAERVLYYWHVEKERPKEPKNPKKFEPTLVTCKLNVSLSFD
jgi:hypothetical protein